MVKRIISSLHFSLWIAIILITFLVLASGDTVYADVSNTASSPDKRPVSVEDILHMKQVSDAQIAPGGTSVAYVVTVVDMKENTNDSDIWISETEDGRPRQLTQGPKTDNRPRWSPDGSTIAFFSNRKESIQIWTIGPSGGEAMPFTDHKGGVSSFVWSPDGKKIAFLAPEPLTEEEDKERRARPIVVDEGYRYQQLWTIDVKTKEVVQVTKGDLYVSDMAWSPDSIRFAVVARPTPRLKDSKFSDIYFVNAEEGSLKKIEGGPVPKRGPGFLLDGRLVYSSSDGMSTMNRKIYISGPQGKNPKAITAQHDEHASFAGSSPEGKTIFFTSRIRAHSHLYSVASNGGEVNQISNGHIVLSSATLSSDGKKTAFILQTSLKPPDVYVSDVTKFSPRQLTTSNPQAAEFALGQQEVIRWESSDGLEIEGVLIKPIGYEPGKRYPLLLLIHGGPSGVWSDGYNLRNSRYPTQAFTGQGYAIIMPNPRGSTGYGEKHRRGNWKDLSGKEWDDCNTGVDKVIEMGIGDPDKLGIMGWSYGGHLTFWGITQTDRYKAGSAGAGANNLISMYSQTDIPGFYSDTYFGFPPWHDYEFYWNRSSLKYVTQVKTPLLIQVGENDARVPKTQSIEYYTALSDLEIPTQLVIYPRQGHGIREPKLVKDLLQRNLDWFKRWILKE